VKSRIQEHFFKLLHQLWREEGQDLVEYALVMALIVFAATAGTRSFATKVSSAFTYLGATFSSTV
jgi:pilus assembly protein Flp/PilA